MGAGEFSRVESAGNGRKAAQLAAMNIADRVRVKMIEAAATGTKAHKTQATPLGLKSRYVLVPEAQKLLELVTFLQAKEP